MNKPQHWIFLLTAVLILALLPGTALAEPEGKIPDYNLTLRDTPSATGDSLVFRAITILDCDNGRVEADKEMAAEGETVTLTVTPEKGYKLTEDSLKAAYTDSAGAEQTAEISTGEKNTFTFTMPAANVEVTAAFEINLWQALQKAIDGCDSYGEKKIQLVKPGEDMPDDKYTPVYTDARGCITAGSEDSALYINQDKNITLDLNGCTIDRNFSERAAEGMVFKIEHASLTLQDSKGGGIITGGWDSDRGIVNLNNASFTLEGGTISARGPAVKLDNSTFTMTGGELSGPGDGSGVGVQLETEDSTAALAGGKITGFISGVNRASGVSVSGSPVIAANGEEFFGLDNLHVLRGETFAVTGPLEEGARIGVKMDEPGVFARGENYTLTPEDAKHFFSDKPAYTVRLNAENNKLLLYEPSTGYPPNHGGNQSETSDDDGDNVLKSPAGFSGELQLGSALADTGETGFSFAEILRLLLLQLLGLARG